MTIYTFVPSPQPQPYLDWGSPSIWSRGVVPNDPGADVVIPPPAAGANGQNIEVSSAYTINSLSLAGNTLAIASDGSLAAAGAVGLAGGLIQLNGTTGSASLAAGALTNGGWIQGNGRITCSGSFLNQAGGIVVGDGLSLTAASFDNAGLLEAASGDLTLTTNPGGFSNLSGSTLTGGAYAGGASGGVLYLNVGALITADAADITLDGPDGVESRDSAQSAYQPIEATLQDIASAGTLVLSSGLTDNWGTLAVDGLLMLEGADPTTRQLTVDPGGAVVGVGSISGPVVDDGVIIAGPLSSYFPQGQAATAAGNTLRIAGPISGSGVLKIAPTLSGAFGVTTQTAPSTVVLGSAASVDVAFLDGTGALILDDPSAFTGSITPAAAGDQIQLAGIALSSVTGDSYAAGQTGGVLTIDLNDGAQIHLNVAAAGEQSFGLSAGPQATASDPPGLLITYEGSGTPLPTPAPDRVRDHFGGAGVSDLVIENSAGSVVAGQIVDGGLVYEQITGLNNSFHNGPAGSSFTGPWTIKGTGDFLGDGNSGVLLENTDGVVMVGEAGGVYTETGAKVGGLGPEWRFEGTGDFLGPGQGVTSGDVGGGWDQFLIENTSGALVLGTVVNKQTVYSLIGGLGPEWSFVGTGAYLGDGRTQFMIENTNGAVDVGEVAGGATSVDYVQVAGLGPEWKFVDSGDFLDDGKSQFLIENTNGSLALGQVGSHDAVQFTPLGGLGPEWKFVGAGDYLGEGYDQFAIENTNGAVVVGDYVAGRVKFTQVGALGREWSFHG